MGPAHAPQHRTTLPPGRMVYPFRLWLPTNALPSVQADTGLCGIAVAYWFEAKVKIAGQFDKAIKLPIRVLSRYVPPEPTVAVTKQLKFTFDEHPVDITCALSTAQLWPGTAVTVRLRFTNTTTSKRISRGSISLAGNVWARARGHQRGGWVSGADVDLAKLPGVLPLEAGQSRDVVVELPVPANVPPTMALSQGGLSWWVDVKLAYGVRSGVARVPVLLQPMVPQSLAYFPATPCVPSEHLDAVFEAPAATSSLMPFWAFLP